MDDLTWNEWLNEKYPHIVSKIKLLWGTIHCDIYLSDVVVKDRPDREGFPFEYLMLIHDIQQHHREKYKN